MQILHMFDEKELQVSAMISLRLWGFQLDMGTTICEMHIFILLLTANVAKHEHEAANADNHWNHMEGQGAPGLEPYWQI